MAAKDERKTPVHHLQGMKLQTDVYLPAFDCFGLGATAQSMLGVSAVTRLPPPKNWTLSLSLGAKNSVVQGFPRVST
jgi:hypothetical protein